MPQRSRERPAALDGVAESSERSRGGRALYYFSRVDGWYALLVCEMPKPDPLPRTGQTVGVDVGITSFAALSNGEEIENQLEPQRGGT